MGVECHHVLIGGVVFVGVLLICIMVPVSFSYVERNTMAFKKNTASNEVDKSKVYPNGRYFWGLARSPVTFPADYQKVSLSLSVFTDGGQEVSLGFVFWYRLSAETLAQLYESFGTSYHSRVESTAKAELRNAAPQFRMEQYLTNRANVSQGFFERLAAQLETKAYVKLQRSKFLLQYISLPSGVMQQKLSIFVVNQEQITALYVANATQVRLETTRQVTVLDNQAALIRQKAEAQAERMKEDARSNSFGRVETERGKQLQFMVTNLGLTTDNSTEKLILLTNLLDAKNNLTILSGVSGAILQSP